MFELFMYVYSCNALSARFSAVYRALNSYFMIMIIMPEYCLNFTTFGKFITRKIRLVGWFNGAFNTILIISCL